MGKYNTKAPKAPAATPAATHQGGTGFKLDSKLELISLLVSGIGNTFYEKETEREKRLADLIKECAQKDPTFVAKALVYTRSVIGQRSVTHRGAVELAKFLSGDELGKRFFSKRVRKQNKGGIIHRLDDMTEIAACYMARNPGKPLSNAIKKGFKDALENADAYELAKYQAKGNTVSLVDVVNLVHPKPSAKMKPVFEQLMKGELKQFNTVEDKNTEAGQVVAEKVRTGQISKAEAAEVLAEAKAENYAQLITERKIGYLALLRNLRNILKTGANAQLIKDACVLLTDQALIKQSLVFPHQIDLALEILLDEFGASARPFVSALNTAYELAIPNLSEIGMYGKTAIVYDVSGSMSTKIQIAKGKNGSQAALDKAALIAATLAKGIGADVYQFANYCKEISYNPNDSVNTLKQRFMGNVGVGGGTEFNSIFSQLKGKYDRVFVISDMQGADSIEQGRWTASTYQAYVAKHGKPHLYSINLCGYSTTMFKPNNTTYQLFGYSADIYELIKKVEIDPKALLKEIEAIVI